MQSRRPADDPKESLIADLSKEISDEPVIEAFRRVPRERFVPSDLTEEAYENHPLPIGYNQTISQPLIVAMMTQALQLTPNDRALEIGTGSGYQAAIISLLAKHVFTVERIAPLAAAAATRLKGLGYDNVTVRVARNELGWPEEAPYDAIIVTAAAPEVPRELLEQLAEGGRLVIPVGGRELQELVRIVKTPAGAVRHNLGPCRFVPLLGHSAWPEGSLS